MRRWLTEAPFWFHAITSGGLFAVVMALYVRVGRDRDWGEALVTGGLGGVFVGVITGVLAIHAQRQMRAAFGDDYEEMVSLPTFGRRRAIERRPELREATARSLLRSRDMMLRARRWTIPLAVVALVIEGWAALNRSPWFWIFVAVFAGLLAGQFLMPRYLDRQVARLRAPADGDGRAG